MEGKGSCDMIDAELLAEQWLYAWDRGEVKTKEDFFSLYNNWKPDNLVFFG